jgi:stage II sporulation protein D
MFRLILLCLCFTVSWFCSAQIVRIGIAPAKKYSRIKFSNASAEYLVVADTTYIGTLNASKALEVLYVDKGKMDLIIGGVRRKGFKNVKVLATNSEQFLEYSASSPQVKPRAFEGDFEIIPLSGRLLVVNDVDLETYLEGVIESEGGKGQQKEYYKAQAVMSRTFALKSIMKHEQEGFNLCNQVHCQAYLHKRNGSSIIDSAVQETRGQVLRSADGNYAPTFFSANCGGETCDPSFIWNERIIGLDPVLDTFCVKTKQAQWVERIDPTDWKTFFVEKYTFPVEDSISYQLLFNAPLTHRKAFFIHPGYGVPMRDIRERFDLKSSFFSVSMEGNQVVLRGRGYGHGVGLCQEGAMIMAKMGFDYTQILGYYLPLFNVVIQPEMSR